MVSCLTHSYSLIKIFLLFELIDGSFNSKRDSDGITTSLQLPPCEACTMVYESFMKAMKLTGQNHFGGGDTSWEEAKLGPYATSEVRLIEIQELLCREKKAQDQCSRLVEEWEHYIEDWWFNKRALYPDLYDYLCMDTLKLCCLSNHYGPDCKPCPGFPDNVCSNNGNCNGSGTRSGNGKCDCYDRYEGSNCEKCGENYYEVVKDNKLLCEPCDKSCVGGCTSSGPQNCNDCAEGWAADSINGCTDIDECNLEKSSAQCKKNEFCQNAPGSYECTTCDYACDGCIGCGPENCLRCSSGYIYNGYMCVRYDSIFPKSNVIRLLVYLGLCLATFIMFKNRTSLASIVCLCVAIFLAITEFELTIYRNELFDTILKSMKIW